MKSDKNIFFFGIGGIGISAIARYYHSIGYNVYGNDRSIGENCELLISLGINVLLGDENIDKSIKYEKIVYTIAISEDNKALNYAKSLTDTEILSYPEALAQISNDKYVIAICGTHGKTTTTAMTYYGLKEASIDASMIVGSLITHDGKKTNYVHGSSKYLIIEACEYRRSFLNYHPNIILITNIDADHLDYFKDINDIKHAFQQFADNLIGDKILITHKDVDFIEADKHLYTDIQNIKLQVPGQHNIINANLVLTLGQYLKLDQGKIINGLYNFPGTWRRQEYKGMYYGVQFYDDYGHHPSEVRVTLEAFRDKYPDHHIVVLFHPHLFSRTKIFLDEFAQALTLASRVLLLPIYPAREIDDGSISSAMLADKINIINPDSAYTVANSIEAIKYIQDYALTHDNIICITMGAGDIDNIYDKL